MKSKVEIFSQFLEVIPPATSTPSTTETTTTSTSTITTTSTTFLLSTQNSRRTRKPGLHFLNCFSKAKRFAKLQNLKFDSKGYRRSKIYPRPDTQDDPEVIDESFASQGMDSEHQPNFLDNNNRVSFTFETKDKSENHLFYSKTVMEEVNDILFFIFQIWSWSILGIHP